MSAVTDTRGYSKLLKHHIVNIQDANTFHSRVINTWDKLPDIIVLAPSISCFKRRLSRCVCSVGSDYFSLSKFLFLFFFIFFCVLFANTVVLCLSGICLRRHCLPWCPVDTLYFS